MSTIAPYACQNRPAPRDRIVVQNGWETMLADHGRMQTRLPVIEIVPVQMSKECGYARGTPGDARCSGCSRSHA
ncbi:hypothetical protein [Pararobbsia silviterrae]|uniref:Uncharacterized protein n=1 Tax=Pararobbsia silviterrae TaxID=1792498 RepID=A0A494X966_9BURK|nr:hypothetical protein [Pararobbsia silviterrae]RKP44734.1 hypothetical protein D7S86_27315 [Pararobbsia silviterrae]